MDVTKIIFDRILSIINTIKLIRFLACLRRVEILEITECSLELKGIPQRQGLFGMSFSGNVRTRTLCFIAILWNIMLIDLKIFL